LIRSRASISANGARLERINWLADPSPKGLAQSYGVMVNYLYDSRRHREEHEAMRAIARSWRRAAVKKLARPTRDLVPAVE